MTITADQNHDLLNIYGGDGIITVEQASPDTIFVDVDLATLAGLQVSGRKLLAKVDGSSVTINGSGQLTAAGGSSTLEGLTDVNIIFKVTDDMLAYNVTTGRWQDQAASVTGSTSSGSGAGVGAYRNLNVETQNAATDTHTHSSSTATATRGDHYHVISDKDDLAGSGPSSTHQIYTSLGGPTGSPRTVLGSVSANYGIVAKHTHAHGPGNLVVNIS